MNHAALLSTVDAVARRRAKRVSRLVRRTREAPLRFVAHKALRTATRPAWNAAYRVNANGAVPPPLRMFATRLSPSQDEAMHSLSRLSAQLNAPTGLVDRGDLVLRADKAMDNRLQLLGFGEIDLGSAIDWNRDYTTGFRWPDRPALALDFVRPDDFCDVKVPWELSRLQMLVWLSQACRLTSEQRYVRHLETVLASWTRANPVGMGIAWSCPMEAAIRGINMAYACALAWEALRPHARHAACLSLREHLTYLRRHPELSDVNGNHYIADLMGSVGLGALLSSAGRTPTWLPREVEVLDAEVARQVGADGVHHEHATGYHRLVTEMVVHAGVALDHAGIPLPASLANSLTSMLAFLRAVAGPRDHELPLIGDSDSGQVCILDCASPNSVRTTVALGDALLGRADGDEPAQSGSPAWVLRARGRAAGRTSLDVSPTSRVFQPSGFLVLAGAESRVVARAGPPGLQGRGAHEHADLTSFTAVLGGLPVVVDPGCSTYTGDRIVRRNELSAGAHNLVILGGRDPFRLRQGSVMDVVSPSACGAIDELDVGARQVRMHHNGYVDADGNPLVHRRLTLSDDGRFLACEDEIQGTGRSLATRRILLGPAWWDPESVRPGEIRFRHMSCDAVLGISFDAGGVVGTGWVAPTYGCRESTHSVMFDGEISLPAVLTCTFRLMMRTRKTGV